MALNFDALAQHLKSLNEVTYYGRVTAVQGLFVEATGIRSPLTIGDRCFVTTNQGKKVPCELVSFKGDSLLLMPYASLEGIGPGCRVDVENLSMFSNE